MVKVKKLALLFSRIGMLRALEAFPTTPGVMVLNYHRIGDRLRCEYDRDLFSASEEQFGYQLSYIKRHFPVILPHELADLMRKKKRLKRLHVMMTFDDGYLDNYTVAFKLLKQLDMRAAFYLVSTFVGTAHIPWWDEISYLVRRSPQSSLSVRSMTFDLQGDRDAAIGKIEQAYKALDREESAAFLQDLRTAVQVDLQGEGRRFIDWSEAREMAAAGMEIGAHTHTHPILSKLTPGDQQEELLRPKAIIEQNMGRPIESLAYPNGSRGDFTGETQRFAVQAGYRTAFSFYGGINGGDGGNSLDLLRFSPSSAPVEFRAKTALFSRFPNMEPMLRRAYR
jgi:peptidoglycan/xylan/chitin deacetylase (PgdA/CDA1 family)